MLNDNGESNRAIWGIFILMGFALVCVGCVAVTGILASGLEGCFQ